MSLSLLNKQTSATLKFATITETLTANDIIFTGQLVGPDGNFDNLTCDTLNYQTLNPPIAGSGVPIESLAAAMSSDFVTDGNTPPFVLGITDMTTSVDPVVFPNVSPSSLYSNLTNNTFVNGVLTIGTAGYYQVNYTLQTPDNGCRGLLMIDGVGQATALLNGIAGSVLTKQSQLLFLDVGQTLQLGITNTSATTVSFVNDNGYIYTSDPDPNAVNTYSVRLEVILINVN